MATELLLLEDVADLGRSGDIVSVKPGYARNFLLPRKFAILADKNARRRQAKLQEERQKKAAQDKKDAEEQAKMFEEITLSATVKVDHEGHMYGSVSALDVVNLLREQNNIEMDKHSVSLKHPIKSTGVHTIELKLKEGVTASLTLKVIPEEAKESQAAEENESESEDS